MRWFWWLIIGILALNALMILLIALALLADKWRRRRTARSDAEEDLAPKREPGQEDHTSEMKVP